MTGKDKHEKNQKVREKGIQGAQDNICGLLTKRVGSDSRGVRQRGGQKSNNEWEIG